MTGRMLVKINGDRERERERLPRLEIASTTSVTIVNKKKGGEGSRC